jgi:hypothetical protein
MAAGGPPLVTRRHTRLDPPCQAGAPGTGRGHIGACSSLAFGLVAYIWTGIIDILTVLGAALGGALKKGSKKPPILVQ